MEVLKVENLSYIFPGQEESLLKEISFSLQKGEFVLLSGESGSGKSILLSCLNGIIPHVWHGTLSGDIYLEGTNSKELTLDEMVKRVGTVLQDVEAQIFHLQVEDELVFGLENLGLPRKEIEEKLDWLLSLVGIDREGNIQHLSGGQKQRLIIGSVLGMLPQVILLDEPLANLDLPSAHKFLSFLAQLARQGKTIIMVEHRLDLAAEYVDRLLYLENGRITINCQEKKIILEKEKEKRNSILVNIEDNSYPNLPIVKIENLTFSYGKKRVLHQLSLEVSQGEKIVILGENGCGKSTFLKVLAGLNKGFTSERFELFSRDIGFVFQNPNHQLFMNTVEKEVALNAPNSQALKETLELFGLVSLRNRHPLTLSQGQKRLLALAAIVVGNPTILLLDEPTIGQDYYSLYKIVEALSWLNKKKGTTILTVTHDQKAAECLADRVFLFFQGTVQEIGDRELIHKYFTKREEM